MSDSDQSDISTINIEDELRQSYLDYAMSVIVGRALPDVRDGLKPVHRRVLFAMNDLNNAFNRPYMKSARIVGDVIGKYHPHGDNAAYDTIVRMAQDFSMRYPLVDGQGNFGSLDGDGAAAMRYTEVRMQKIAHELLADLDKETVDFVENYDGTLQMPEVLPAKLPNLLINGSSGIAVGMATNIPPHNLTEVVNGCLALIDNPELTVDELMEYVTGPDFPTAGIINGRGGIVQAYRTGRGRIQIRSRCEIVSDEKSGKDTIIIKEIPFMVNRARLIEKIAELVKDKKIEGITELRDESAVDTRIVIELRRGEVGEVILNNLYAQTQLQSVFGINIVALVEGEPKVLNLKQVLEQFVLHRREVVTRRTVFLLRRARARGHVLEGLAVALSNIDPVIELIKSSANAQEAREKLVAQPWKSDTVVQMLEKAGPDAAKPEDMDEIYGLKDNGDYFLSPEQAQAILEMRLNRLTGLEQEKLLEEYKEIIDTIAELMEILSNPATLMQLIRDELVEIVDEYGDERRTEIVETQEDLTMEDLITEQDMVVTLSHGGYAKTQPLDTYRAQRRGGRGKTASSVKDEDYIEHLMVSNTHDTILCFTNRGKVYWLRVFQIPPASRTARGRPMVNILPLEEDEKITAMLPVHEYTENEFIFMATLNGTVKKTPLMDFSRQRSTGLIAIELEEGNTLVSAAITDGTRDVMLFGSGGKVIRFKESDVRAMGRTARGVRGIKLKPGETVISLLIPDAEGQVLIASRNGYGKRSNIEDYSVIGRGGQGVIGMKLSERNGDVVGAVQVFEGDEVILISDQGTLVRTKTDEVSVQGRNTQGVRLINLASEEHLVGMAAVDEPEGTEFDDEDDDES
ncbi:MAG: DNA gyrase subunit A [Pseudomonadales bacterium]|nr:DNA gyrase subunit A [Pseudomonadales bacterium]MBO6656427.1 DNA gyrase subunit A [Pseudomonadales bacterium]MBO6702654.1 DNA gyrase subunit A [Pseudomonadales bacterium]MBO7004732.1 DNA gyrase subunit A [Pseudomonadales bacterium]